jgi:hypothetical protein
MESSGRRMKISMRLQCFLAISLLLASGCSALPGLRVLSGETSSEVLADQVVELSDMVMADKSGTTDPSLLAAADRVEAAALDVDIIEVRRDLGDDTFSVYLLFQPQATDAQGQDEALRRAVELTWQGMMQASTGADVLSVKILQPQPVPTLDKGTSFVGFVAATFDIARSDAVAYLAHRPNTISDFINLIADGRLTFDQPQDAQFYDGHPNHPVFMLAQMEAQVNAAQGAQPSQ